MGTVPEVIAAKEGMDVIVLSLVTSTVVIPEKNRSIKEEVEAELAGSSMDPHSKQMPKILSHEEVLNVGEEKAKSLVQRIVELV